MSSLVAGCRIPNDLEYIQHRKDELGDRILMAGLLRHRTRGEELPILFYFPKEWSGEVVIWLHKDGKAGLFQGNELRPKSGDLWLLARRSWESTCCIKASSSPRETPWKRRLR